VDACPGWPPTWAAHGGASEGGFHHALEAFVTKGAFLAGVRAQLLQVVGRDACVQPLLVGAGETGTEEVKCFRPLLAWVARAGVRSLAGPRSFPPSPESVCCQRRALVADADG
jgi:hypothetical protein